MRGVREEVLLTSLTSVAEAIQRLVRQTSTSLDAALYRFNSPRLARALEDALQRGVRLRLVLDRGKYAEAPSMREVLENHHLPFRLSAGRQGPGSKMHHKFAILDGQIVLTGSYNWTLESEEANFENLVVLRQPPAAEDYTREFERLWKLAGEAGGPAREEDSKRSALDIKHGSEEP
jgi:phosphatidylserine/phosphatidylglycerophosphate/cardiolipin synthase-like enzyme